MNDFFSKTLEDMKYYDNMLLEDLSDEDRYFNDLLEDWDANSYLASEESHEIWY